MTPAPLSSSTTARQGQIGQILVWVAAELGWTLLQSFLLAIVARLVMMSFRHNAALLSIWAVCAVAVLVLRLQRLALPRRKRTRDNAVAGHTEATLGRILRFGPSGHNDPRLVWAPPLPETLEHRFRRMYRHVDRLTYAVVATRHYDAGVRPALTEIARDRLRRCYGINLATQPEDARAVIGDDLWTALTTPLARPPTVRDLDRWLTRLEQMTPERIADAQRRASSGQVLPPPTVTGPAAPVSSPQPTARA